MDDLVTGIHTWEVMQMRNCLNIVKEFVQEEDAVGVVEIILILVGIFTPYYGVGIRCMA